MKITVFTSNKPRHLYLMKLLSKIVDKLYVFQEFDLKEKNFQIKIKIF